MAVQRYRKPDGTWGVLQGGGGASGGGENGRVPTILFYTGFDLSEDEKLHNAKAFKELYEIEFRAQVVTLSMLLPIGFYPAYILPVDETTLKIAQIEAEVPEEGEAISTTRSVWYVVTSDGDCFGLEDLG